MQTETKTPHPDSTPESTAHRKRDEGGDATGQLAVCVVTGFLGSGKTTFLNHVLHSQTSVRIGVLVNDFGRVNIDSMLVEQVEGDTISLSNGCICCSIREDFLKALVQLVDRPTPPEFVIVETSGVSDPLSVVATLAAPALRGALRVDTVLTVVDASEFLELDEHRATLAEAQIKVADLVAINKVDLVSPETLAAVRTAVAAIAPSARTIEVTQGAVPFELIHSGGLRLPPPSTWTKLPNHERPRVSRLASPVSHEHCSCGHEHHEHDHVCTCHDDQSKSLSAAFESWFYETELPLSLTALRETLRQLPREVYRLKGVFQVQEDPDNALILQVVGNRINEALFKPWRQMRRMTTVVAIGDAGRINAETLTRTFDACVAKGEPSRPMSIVERAISYLRSAGMLPGETPSSSTMPGQD
jgi:G3E family GTPase